MYTHLLIAMPVRRSLHCPKLNHVRRRLLKTGAATALLFASSLTTACCPEAFAAGEGRISITPTSVNEVMRVRIDMNVKGNVHVPSDPLVSRKKELSLPVQSDAILDYEERYRRPTDGDLTSEVVAVERYYHEATTNGTLNRSKTNLALRDSVRQTQVRRDTLPETVYAVDDYFTHDELSLLKVPVSSVSVDRLLPNQPVQVGSKYQLDRNVLASVLNLTFVRETTVVSEVVSIDADNVRFELKGRVEASVEGVPTTMKMIGKLTFDRKIGTSSWLAVAIHETREIGKAEPGFDVLATVKMIRQPMPATVGLPVEPADMTILAPVAQDRLYVDVRSNTLGVSTIMDRHWRLMSDLPGNTFLRMTENDRSIAQCNLRPLARLEPGKQRTLEAFQQDVQHTLGDQLEDLLEADQRLSASGLRVLRVVAQGAVEGVPIQWIMIHFSDDSGRRMLATFTMENGNVESFMGSDAQFADSFRFEKTPSNANEVEEKDQPTSEVAQMPSSKNRKKRDAEVESASDLR